MAQGRSYMRAGSGIHRQKKKDEDRNMAKKENKYKGYDITTQAIHTGTEYDMETGAVRRPLHMANSFKLPDDLSQVNYSSTDLLMYARNGNPNQHWLEEKIAALNQKPLELGADFVVEAITKYINGHGDAQGGAILSNDLETMDRIRYEAQVNVGSVISPFNAWQIFRGSVTFPLRMERINKSAQKIAEWLEGRENVTFVSYPGLPSHPGHGTAAKQMNNGYGGVISFGLNADDKTVERFCAALKVVTFAVSLGHDASLIFPQPSYDERIHLYPERFRNGFIRFSVGLEDPDDIILDLDQALKAIGL